jgi:hypothetical protein
MGTELQKCSEGERISDIISLFSLALTEIIVLSVQKANREHDQFN